MHGVEATITTLLFAVAILLPLFGFFFRSNETTAAVEARTLAAPPNVPATPAQWNEFPARFDAYFADHFGFRSAMLEAGNSLKSRLLGISPSPNVVIGRLGWLYYAGEELFDSFRGTRSLSAAELTQWRNGIDVRQQWLAAHGGATYYLAFVPEKQTIYPEFVPARYKPVRATSPLQQLREYLKDNPKVMDFRAAVSQAKIQAQVCYKTDTHWNSFGAFAAYQQLLRALHVDFPALVAEDRSQFLLKLTPRTGDLARIVGWNTQEPMGDLQPIARRASERQPLNLPNFNVPAELRPFATEVRTAPELPRAVIIHDSFAIALMPLLSEHFSRVVFMRRLLLNSKEFEAALARLVDNERPDLVIEEIAERHVVVPPDAGILFGGAPQSPLAASQTPSPLLQPSRPPNQTRGPIPPHERYALKWLERNVPATMKHGSEAAVYVRVKNTGDWTWRDRATANPQKPDGSYAVRLGYKWIDEAGHAAPDTGVRGELTNSVAPGEIAELTVAVSAPATPGRYQLQLDLVEELVAWFSDRRAEKLLVPVSVE